MSEITSGLLQNCETQAIVDQEQFSIELKNYYSGHDENSKKLEWTSARIESVIKLIDEYNFAKAQGKRPTNKQYHHANKYDVMNLYDQRVLIKKRKEISDPVLQIIPTEEYYQRILDAHIATGHGRRDRVVHALKDTCIIPIFAITSFINLCKTCLAKKSYQRRKVVVKPLIFDGFYRRGQIDLLDFQTSPDGEYKWLLQYLDHLTTFCFLRPLKSQQAKEVAIEILKIFLEVGCPNILQSDNSKFTASVVEEVGSLWPDCAIVNGTSRDTCTSSTESSNQDVKNMIQAWMADNKSTNWSLGCYFVQYKKNYSYNSTIGSTPYQAFFGRDPKLGFPSTYLPKNIISTSETEEDVERVTEKIGNNQEQHSEKDQKTEEQEKILTETKTDSPTMKKHQVEVPIMDVEINMIKQEEETDDENIDEENVVSNNSHILPNADICVKLEEISVCYICKNETSREYKCITCNRDIHVTCGVVLEENEGYGLRLLCNLCVNEPNTVQGREQSHLNLKRVADEIIATPSKKYKDRSIGSCVQIEVPKVGPSDNKNLTTKDKEERNELHRILTAYGIIKD